MQRQQASRIMLKGRRTWRWMCSTRVTEEEQERPKARRAGRCSEGTLGPKEEDPETRKGPRVTEKEERVANPRTSVRATFVVERATGGMNVGTGSRKAARRREAKER